MKKLRIEREVGGLKVVLVTPKPSDAPYVAEAINLASSVNASTRMFGFYAMLGFMIREPILSAKLIPDSEYEVGKREIIAYGKLIMDELSDKFGDDEEALLTWAQLIVDLKHSIGW